MILSTMYDVCNFTTLREGRRIKQKKFQFFLNFTKKIIEIIKMFDFLNFLMLFLFELHFL